MLTLQVVLSGILLGGLYACMAIGFSIVWGVTNLMTAYGPIRFNEKGQNIAKGMSVVQVQNGKPVVVFPLEGAQAKFVFPLPPR